MDRDLAINERRSQCDPGDEQSRWRSLLLRSRLESSHLLLEAVKDVDSWAKAPAVQRKHIIDVLRQKLEPDYEWLGTDTFTEASRSYEIPRFIHKATGVQLHLSPGAHAVSGEKRRNFNGIPKGIFAVLIGRYPVLESQWKQVHDGAKIRARRRDRPAVVFHTHPLQGWFQKANKNRKVRAPLRLPNSQEWIHACAAGSEDLFSWGNKMDSSRCWHISNSDRHLQNIYEHKDRANAFGLVDMHGHIYERSGPAQARSARVHGGDVWSSASRCTRKAAAPAYARFIGFRVACSISLTAN